MDVTHLVTTI